MQRGSYFPRWMFSKFEVNYALKLMHYTLAYYRSFEHTVRCFQLIRESIKARRE